MRDSLWAHQSPRRLEIWCLHAVFDTVFGRQTCAVSRHVSANSVVLVQFLYSHFLFFIRWFVIPVLPYFVYTWIRSFFVSFRMIDLSHMYIFFVQFLFFFFFPFPFFLLLSLFIFLLQILFGPLLGLGSPLKASGPLAYSIKMPKQICWWSMLSAGEWEGHQGIIVHIPRNNLIRPRPSRFIT